MDDSVNKSRLYVATCALVRQKYPSDLAAVIIDDTSLPAWEEAVEQAAAVIQSLELQGLFARVAEVNAIIKAKDLEISHLQIEVNRAKDDLRTQVDTIVRRRLSEKEREWFVEMRDLENRLYETEEILDNMKLGVEVKKQINRFGPIHHVDYDIIQDDDFELDYQGETYKRRPF